MGEIESVQDRAHLHGERVLVDRAHPDEIARFPGRAQEVRTFLTALALEHPHLDGVALARDLEPLLGLPELHDAARIPAHRTARQLAGNFSLALSRDGVDRGGNRGHELADPAFRLAAAKSVRKLLRDESGRELAGAEALVLHHGREERDVVADAV